MKTLSSSAIYRLHLLPYIHGPVMQSYIAVSSYNSKQCILMVVFKVNLGQMCFAVDPCVELQIKRTIFLLRLLPKPDSFSLGLSPFPVFALVVKMASRFAPAIPHSQHDTRTLLVSLDKLPCCFSRRKHPFWSRLIISFISNIFKTLNFMLRHHCIFLPPGQPPCPGDKN